MRALTLWQPWASLVALGGKQWETRSWQTNYRGPLLIHAAGKRPPRIDDWRTVDEMIQVLGVSEFDELPRGVILAAVDLSDVALISAPPGPRRRYLREFLLGKWDRGRYAWRLQNVRRLEFPVPARGRQRLWTPSDLLCEHVHAELLRTGG